jgi:hypothetical protein
VVDDGRDDAVAPVGVVPPGHRAASDQAVFVPVRVPRERVPATAVAVVLIIAGLAVTGILGTNRPPLSPNAATVPDAPIASGLVDVPRRTPPPQSIPLLAMDARTSGRLLFVHGDVFTRAAVAVVVTVSVADGRNRTLNIRSVDMPGGSTAFRTSPNDRFFLTFELGDSPTMHPAWVMANAYDERGSIIATARVQVNQFAIEAPAAYKT